MDSSFHHTDEQYAIYAHRSVSKAIADGRLHPDDEPIVKAYLSEISTTGNLSATRRAKVSTNLMSIIGYLPRLREIRQPDIYTAFESVKTAKRKSTGQPLTQNTIADFSRSLKRFLRWLIENEYISIDPKKIDKIRLPAYKAAKTDGDLLSPDEIERLIQTPRSIQYRALLGVLYECGLRIHEAALLRWRDITFTSWGAKVRTSGKTQKIRVVPLVGYKDLLSKWKSEHPCPDPDELVFINIHRKPLKYASVLKNIRGYAKTAGIERKICLHDIRHSRVTHALQDGLSETHAKRIFWGNLDSDMIKNYCHLTDQDSEDALLELSGVERPGEKREPSLHPVQCHECLHINAPKARFCSECGTNLDPDAAVEIQQLMEFIQKKAAADPATLLKIVEVLKD